MEKYWFTIYILSKTDFSFWIWFDGEGTGQNGKKELFELTGPPWAHSPYLVRIFMV